MNYPVAAHPRTRLAAWVGIVIVGIAGFALLAAPPAQAQSVRNSAAREFRQTALTLPSSNNTSLNTSLSVSATNTGAGSIAATINCTVFGILDSLGIMQHPSSGCSSAGFPGFPGFPFIPGGGSGGGTTTPQRATLSVVDFVSGGTSTPSMFTLRVTGGNPSPSVFTGNGIGTTVTLDSGISYAVTADPQTNYVSSYSPGCSGSLSPGAFSTCVVTNTFVTPTSTPTTTPQVGAIRVFKMVQAGTGRTTATSSDFVLHLMNASSTEVVGSPHVGSATGTLYTMLPLGVYWLSETGVATSSFTPSFSGDCSSGGMITLSSSTTRTCTLTNTFIATSTATSTPQTGMITLIKKVTGTSTAASSSAFTLHLKNASTSAEVAGSPQMGSATGTTYANLPPGNYIASETGGPSGYAMSWSGDCDSNGVMTLTASSSKTCTLTNTQLTGNLKIIKLVTGANASTSNATSSDFWIHLWSAASTSTMASTTEIAGSPRTGSATGTTFAELPLGTYRATESGVATSTFTPTWSGDCDANGFVSIVGTGLKTCTLTNALMATSTATST